MTTAIAPTLTTDLAHYFTTAKVDQSYGIYDADTPCCVGAHLAHYLQVTTEDDEITYNTGAEAWARAIGANRVQAILLLRAAGANHDPFSSRPWRTAPEIVFRRLAKIEELPATAGADLFRVLLRDSNLPGADLRDADLSHVQMFRVNLEGANLEGASLVKAHAPYANMRRAGLEGASLEGAFLSHAVMRDALLKGARLDYAGMGDVDLHGADLRGASLKWVSVNFNTWLTYADLSGAHLESIWNLRHVDCAKASFRGATLKDMTLRGACLHGADFRGARFEDVSLEGASLRGARFLVSDLLQFNGYDPRRDGAIVEL